MAQFILTYSKSGIPWRLSMARAKADYGFGCMSLDEAVKIHINDARIEAGLPLIQFK
jgi:hypothetical protein